MASECKIKRGFKKIGINVEDIADKYEYCGSTSNFGTQYWEHVCKDEKKPGYKNRCVCGTRIVNNAYIINRNEVDEAKRILVLGTCCIKRFTRLDRKYCIICGENNPSNSFNVCRKCRKTRCKFCTTRLDKGLCMICMKDKTGLGKLNVRIGKDYRLVNGEDEVTMTIFNYTMWEKRWENQKYIKKYKEYSISLAKTDGDFIKYIDNVMMHKACKNGYAYRPMMEMSSINAKYFGDTKLDETAGLKLNLSYVWMKDNKMGICPNILGNVLTTT